MILAKATWTEVDALDREQVVVVPIGGTTQFGPFLPLGTTTAIMDRFATDLDVRCADKILVCPTLPYGVAGGDGAFAGTVDLGYETLIATIRATVSSLTRHRFHRFLFVCSQVGGTLPSIEVALRATKDESPRLQLAHLVVGWHRQLCARALLSFSPEEERTSANLATQRTRMDSPMSGCFVFDTDEILAEGFRYAPLPENSEPDRTISDAVNQAADLIDVMREGRVYVETPYKE